MTHNVDVLFTTTDGANEGGAVFREIPEHVFADMVSDPDVRELRATLALALFSDVSRWVDVNVIILADADEVTS